MIAVAGISRLACEFGLKTIRTIFPKFSQNFDGGSVSLFTSDMKFTYQKLLVSSDEIEEDSVCGWHETWCLIPMTMNQL